ncbi:hypothetical protein [Microbacterium suwonense]|uniref:Uncharacterized protein n=1 Tax=Microbacterium suwonense TaxID=683047 RepID=A0ABN6WZY8_9MICO|nr:hypothetical protein [Microbacterium suwonense]BDZ38005.1 hypothetical protein GCM10025863_06190 [Microbacterium suwonense]
MGEYSSEQPCQARDSLPMGSAGFGFGRPRDGGTDRAQAWGFEFEGVRVQERQVPVLTVAAHADNAPAVVEASVIGSVHVSVQEQDGANGVQDAADPFA